MKKQIRQSNVYICDYCNREFIWETAAKRCEEKCRKYSDCKKNWHNDRVKRITIETRCERCGSMNVHTGDGLTTEQATLILNILKDLKPEE